MNIYIIFTAFLSYTTFQDLNKSHQWQTGYNVSVHTYRNIDKLRRVESWVFLLQIFDQQPYHNHQKHNTDDR